MKQIKLIDKNWRILQKGGSVVTYGAGATSGKYIRLNSTIKRNSTNNYTMTISASASSSSVYNGYGVNVYAHVGGTKTYKGTVYISGGSCSPSSFTHDFTISSNTNCYASCICAYCESGYHSDYYNEFVNQTASDTATYENSGTAPTNPRLTLDKTGVVEGRITLTTAYDCSNPYGTVYYNYATSTNASTWTESGWITSSTAGYTITNMQRGVTHYFRVKVKNGIGESSWSSYVSVKANSIPIPPNNLTVNTTRPVNSVTLNWSGASEPDGQTITYKTYVSKNDGEFALVTTTSGTSYSYNISGDAQGTRYKFKVEAYDTLGVYATSSTSGEFIKATQPYVTGISSNKTGLIEGDVTISASSACSYPPDSTQYQFAYYYDGIGWQDQGWQTAASYTLNITSQRGKNWFFRVRAKNSAGTSDWSNVISVKANSIPIPASGLSHLPKYPVSTVNLLWNVASDADGHAITYKVYISKNSGGYSLIGTTTSRELSYNISSDAEGTKYKFKVESYDTLGVYSTSSESAEFFKPITPTASSFVAPTVKIHEANVSVKWNSSNFHSLNGYYVLEKRVDGGNWQEAVSSTTSTSYTFDITSIDRGSSIQFRIKAVNEAGQASIYTESITINRNRIPNAVTNITPGVGYYIGAITFGWDAATDPDGQAVTYRLYLSKDEGAYTLMGSTSNTSYNWSIPGGDIGETKYRIKVESIDELGATNNAIGPLIKKPTPPSAPTNLKPGDGYYEGNIDFTWTASNFYGQQGNYHLEIYTDGTLVKTDTSNTNSYRYNLSSVPRGSKVTYKVKAKNVFDQESSWTANTSNMRHNRIPEAPAFILPLDSKPINSKIPKIIIKSNQELDNQTMTVNVKYKNINYNSANNPEFFSKTTIGNNEYIIFKHTSELDVGDNIIQASVSDGLINSQTVSLLITVEDNINYVNSGDIIDHSYHNLISKTINNARVAYGLKEYNFNTINSENYIKADDVNIFIISLNELTKKIDSYHEDNKLKYNFLYEKPIANSTIINKDHYNQICKTLNNL